MKHYSDIKHSDYTHLHISLVDKGISDVGIGFSGRGGMRVFGSKERLEQLGFEAKDTPEDCAYCRVSRVRRDKSMSKLRRLLKRGSIDKAQSLKYIADMQEEARGDKDYLHVNMFSHSTQRAYKRYFDLSYTGKSVEGVYDSFGLSDVASVPFF